MLSGKSILAFGNYDLEKIRNLIQFTNNTIINIKNLRAVKVKKGLFNR